MSKIIAKPFNKSKKILRAVFQGSPNLFTTSDLNRQIEAFSRRINDIETYVSNGVVSDLSLSYDSDTSELEYTLSYLELFGCVLYSGADLSGKLGSLSFGPGKPLFLWYTISKIDYNEDTTHEISGVKFEDGTSKEAADHLVIDSWGLTSVFGSIPLTAEKITLCSDIKIVEYEGVELLYVPSWRKPSDASITSQLLELQEDVDKMSSLLQTKTSRAYIEDHVVTRPLQRDDVSCNGDVYMSLNGFSLSVVVNGSLASENPISEGEVLRFYIPLTSIFTEEDLELLSTLNEHSRNCIKVDTEASISLAFLWYTPTSQGAGDLNGLPEYTKYLVIEFTALKELDYAQHNIQGNIVVMR